MRAMASIAANRGRRQLAEVPVHEHQGQPEPNQKGEALDAYTAHKGEVTEGHQAEWGRLLERLGERVVVEVRWLQTVQEGLPVRRT
jgi:hypothetical protein